MKGSLLSSVIVYSAGFEPGVASYELPEDGKSYDDRNSFSSSSVMFVGSEETCLCIKNKSEHFLIVHLLRVPTCLFYFTAFWLSVFLVVPASHTVKKLTQSYLKTEILTSLIT